MRLFVNVKTEQQQLQHTKDKTSGEHRTWLSIYTYIYIPLYIIFFKYIYTNYAYAHRLI